MSEFGNEIIGKPNSSTDRIDSTEDSSLSVTTIASVPDSVPVATHAVDTAADGSLRANNGKRRGIWKRVRVRPADNFETAESQNYGSRVYNSLLTPGLNTEKEQLNEDTLKLQNFALDEAVEENEPQRDHVELESVTNVPISTASSPGDIDLGTGAPVLVAIDGDKQTTTIPPHKVQHINAETTTTNAPEPEPTSTETIKAEDSDVSEFASSTTVTSTRRYDISEEDDMMMEDDHTDFPTANDHGHSNDEVTDTEPPLPQLKQPYNSRETVVPTVSAFYDDYDTEFRTSPSTVNDDDDDVVDDDTASEAAPTVAAAESAEPTGNLMSDVKQKLTELFSFGVNDDYDYGDSNVIRPLSGVEDSKSAASVTNRQQYTTIERQRPTQEVLVSSKPDAESSVSSATEASAAPLPTQPTTAKSFHRNLMDSVIYATSTSTEVSHETEICYRGRCIKTDKKLH